MELNEVLECIREYEELVERLEGVWEWSEYDLEHDQDVRASISTVALEPVLQEKVNELDQRYMAATVECPKWREYVKKPNSSEFWWRFPLRTSSYWEDFFVRNGL